MIALPLPPPRLLALAPFTTALLLAVATPSIARAEPRVSECADAAEQGQELRASQKLVAARQRFVACAQRDCPSAVRESCTEWLADLDRRLPSLVVSAKDEQGHDVRDVLVTLDGAHLPDNVTSVAAPVDPGPHTLRCEAAGHEPVTEDLVLREGEPLRVFAVTLRSSLLPIGPEPPPKRHFPVLPVILGATSLVALGVFAVAGGTAVSEFHSLEQECAPRCSSDRIDAVRTRFLVADVALVVGLVSGASALAVWLFDRPSTSHVAAAAR